MDDHDHDEPHICVDIGKAILDARNDGEEYLELSRERLEVWYDGVEEGASTEIDRYRRDIQTVLDQMDREGVERATIHTEQVHEWHDIIDRHIGCTGH